MKKTVLVFTILLAVVLSGCNNDIDTDSNAESQIPCTSADLGIENLTFLNEETTCNPLKTLDEAMDFFLHEVEAKKYKCEYFAASYRILDAVELQKDGITIYAHILCEWIDKNGIVDTGLADVAAVTFRKDNDIYEYEKLEYCDFPKKTNIPQTVKDAASEASYFADMRAEVDKEKADFMQLLFIGGGDKPNIDYGNSEKFSKEEIKSAIDCVIENFTFPDCTLTEIWYDENQSNSAVEGYIRYGHGAENGVKTENIIIIFTNFTAGSNSPVLNPNEEYTNYNWILIRDSNEDMWKLDDLGY